MTSIKPFRTRTTVVSLFLSICFMTGCASTKVSDIPASDVDMSGTWALNQYLSADTKGAIAYAMAEARGARSNSHGSGGMRGGNGGGMRGRMVGGGPDGGGRRGSKRSGASAGQTAEPRERLEVLVAELSPSTDQIVIEQSATELIVAYGPHWQYRHLFGEELAVSVAGYEGESLSGWQEQQYVVETKTENGSTVSERFSVSPDGRQLRITLTLESERLADPINVTRVYDRTPALAVPAASTQ